jgi:hypothetical protein
MLTTPGGRPISWRISATLTDDKGVRSDGFRMYELPAAIAIGRVQSGTMNGKLNGVTAAVTPSG